MTVVNSQGSDLGTWGERGYYVTLERYLGLHRYQLMNPLLGIKLQCYSILSNVQPTAEVNMVTTTDLCSKYSHRFDVDI